MARKRPAKLDERAAAWFSGIPGYDPVSAAAPGEWFDQQAASDAIEFFATCIHHIEGSFAGKPFILRPWQEAIVANLFGWKRADGSRRFREGLLYVPRGNGKTPLLAGIGLKLEFSDDEAGAQIYSVAANADQASLTYRHASGMVRAEPELNSRAQIFKGMGHRAIAHREDQATVYRVIPSDGAVAHGFNPHAVLADELHAWEHFDLLSAIETAFRKKGRRQPLLLWATTADYDRPSPCNEKYDYASKVRDGIVKDSAFLPVIYEAPADADWTMPATWAKANPNLGVTVDEAALTRAVAEAIHQPSKQAEFKRLHLNIRTSSHTVWIPIEQWDACRADINPAALEGRECYAGLDVSSKQDLTAFVLLFPPTHDEMRDYERNAIGRERVLSVVGGDLPDEPFPLTIVLPYFWVPGDDLVEKGRADNVNYRGWVDEGWIFATDGNEISEREIEAFIVETHEKRYRIRELAFDSWNAKGMAQRLTAAGINCVEIPPTIAHLTYGTKAFAGAVASRKLAHDGNAVMRWMVSCAEVKQDINQNIRPVKPKRETGKKIDGVIAAIQAMGRMAVAETAGSVYETRGVLVL